MPSDCGPLELAPAFDLDLIEVTSCSFSWDGDLLMDTPVTYQAVVANPNIQDAMAGVRWELRGGDISGEAYPVVAETIPTEVPGEGDVTQQDTRALNDPVQDADNVITRSRIDNAGGWFIHARVVDISQQAPARAPTRSRESITSAATARGCGCDHGAESPTSKAAKALVPGD